MQNHTIRYNTMQYYTTVFNFKQYRTIVRRTQRGLYAIVHCTMHREATIFDPAPVMLYNTIQCNTMQYPTIHHFWRVPGYVVPYTVTVTVF